MINCFNNTCNKEFTPKTHNQKYCSDECCRISTNRKIMEKYYEKKAIKNGAKRLCAKCKARLSRYNIEPVCNLCVKKQNSKHNNEVNTFLNDIGLS